MWTMDALSDDKYLFTENVLKFKSKVTMVASQKHTIPGYSKHSKIILMHLCTFSPLNSLDLQINFESEQSLQTKQDSLLLRIDDLDQENRELKDQVSEIEEEKDRIEETLEKVQKNVKQYKQKLKDNQVQIDNTCIYNIWCLQV